jgi:hypothetical protein
VPPIAGFGELFAGSPEITARHADPRTTTIYDQRRENFDRHAAYVVVAFVAEADDPFILPRAAPR